MYRKPHAPDGQLISRSTSGNARRQLAHVVGILVYVSTNRRGLCSTGLRVDQLNKTEAENKMAMLLCCLDRWFIVESI